MVGERSGRDCERIRVEGGEEEVKRLMGPMRPSAKTVERHYVSGHIVYRKWCPVSVQAR